MFSSGRMRIWDAFSLRLPLGVFRSFLRRQLLNQLQRDRGHQIVQDVNDTNRASQSQAIASGRCCFAAIGVPRQVSYTVCIVPLLGVLNSLLTRLFT